MAIVNLITLSAKQGDVHRWKVRVTEDDDTPFDLTGWVWEFSVAKDRRKTPAWTFTTAPQVVTSAASSDPDAAIDPEEGEVQIGLLPDDLRAFGKLEELQFELTGHPAGQPTERLSVLDGTVAVRLEVAGFEVSE